MYYIVYNGIRCIDIGLQVVRRPNIPAPEMRYDEVTIPGRDGSLYKRKNTYLDLEIEVEFNFLSNPDAWGEVFRKMKQWIYRSGDSRLEMSDDGNYYWKVKKVLMSDSERIIRQIGRFRTTFVCDPHAYLKTGFEPMPIAKIIYNDYSQAMPVYQITGEGMCTIIRNGKSITANVGQNLTIDTSLQLCYREQEMRNTNLTGVYSDMWLAEGENRFKWSNGFDIQIVPNWRCL